MRIGRALRTMSAWPAFGAALLTACAARHPAQIDLGESTKAAVRGVAEDLRERRNLPGLAFGVSAGGRLVIADGVGWADIETRAGATGATRFRIGSISKLLTATAAVRLAARGALDLDAPIGRYLPGLPHDKARLTARQLGGHLAGIRHYGRDEYLNREHFASVGASLSRFIDDPLLAAPGSRYLYSSYGFNLLGAVIEAAAGREFRRVVADEVLAPLGMSDTLAEDSTRADERLAHAYSTGPDGGPEDAPVADLSDRWPSGGYDSTAADLLRFGAGVLRSDYLSRRSRALLFTPQHTIEGEATEVGLGWEVGADGAGRLVVFHGGATFGGRSVLAVWPDDGVVAVLLTNLTLAPVNVRDAFALVAPLLGSDTVVR